MMRATQDETLRLVGMGVVAVGIWSYLVYQFVQYRKRRRARQRMVEEGRLTPRRPSSRKQKVVWALVALALVVAWSKVVVYGGVF
jgi:hypothetical protein